MTNEERAKAIVDDWSENHPILERYHLVVGIVAALDEKDAELRKRVAELENEMTHLAQQRFGNI